MSRRKHDDLFKLKVVKEYEEGGISCHKLAQKYGINAKCVRSWCRLYKEFGENTFTSNRANINYSAEFKRKVVASYLEGGKTYQAVAIAYGIFAPTTVRAWVMIYNNHEELMDSRPEGLFDMVKNTGRSTTLEERIQIVEYCMKNDKNYALAAKEFHVSYGQVYAWVRKYEQTGPDGLLDHRGKRKDESSLSELECLRIENRMLKAKQKQQQMEIDFLKKLEEIERR